MTSSHIADNISMILSSLPVLSPSHTHGSLQALHTNRSPRHKFYTPMKSAPRSFFKALFFGTKLGAAHCMTFHLQTFFQSDALETQRFYISNGLKKPNRVLI